jgi:hypothetical protein
MYTKENFQWMRSSRVVIERLTTNAELATVLDSIPASSDTVESEGRQMKYNKENYKNRKIEIRQSEKKLMLNKDTYRMTNDL